MALHDRFDNKRLILHAHLEKLFGFPPLKSSSLSDLKIFLDTFQENIGAIKTFEIPDKEGRFYIVLYCFSNVGSVYKMPI